MQDDRPIRVYIATTLTNWKAHNELRDLLCTDGEVELTYDWTIIGSAAHLGIGGLREIGIAEIEAVRAADVVVVLLPGGKGTHTELGAAIGANKPVIMYAPETPEVLISACEGTTTFYHHPNVTAVGTIESLLRGVRIAAKHPHIWAEATFEWYDRASKVTAVYPRVHPKIPVYPALGLSGESGEVAEKVKKMLRDGFADGSEVMPDEARDGLLKELGDVLWYVAAFARDIGSDIRAVARMNIAKLADRERRNRIHGSGDNR